MNRICTRRAIGTFATLAIVASAGMLVAGPLTPPGGPVASTYKTLSEVEPRIAINAANTPGDSDSVFRISQPGSYYLTGNVTVPSAKHGIEIGVPGVTLDLNGFSIQGQAGSKSGVSHGGSPVSRIRVMNGMIENMGDDGLYFAIFNPTAAQNIAIERLIIRRCDGKGAYFNDGTARDCQFMENTGTGLYCLAWFDSIVEGCTATGNGDSGIWISRGTVRGCSVKDNPNTGITNYQGVVEHSAVFGSTTGISGEATLVSDCSVTDCTTGIRVAGKSVVRNNAVSAFALTPGSVGIRVDLESGGRVEGNNIMRHALGIVCSTPNNLLVGNSFTSCTNAINAVAGNRVGAILAGTYSPAINGNSGGGLGFTDPNANILY
jgi:hypothetical protein